MLGTRNVLDLGFFFPLDFGIFESTSQVDHL
jgi:hypothetical protein